MDLMTRARWRKSTRSGNVSECLEVADNLPGVVAVRDSKDPDGPVLRFGREEWAAFVSGTKEGEFDR